MNMLAQTLIAQSNREVVANPIGWTNAYRIREFLRIIPLEYSGSKVEKDPNGFIGEVYKNLAFMGLTSTEKAEMDPLQIESCGSTFICTMKGF